MARPRKKIDPLQVEQLAMIGCPNSEIAGILGCDEAILCPRFDRAIRKGQLRRNIALRRKMYELAMRGNVTMLVWLGKLCLAQTDKPPLSELLHHEHEAIGSLSIAPLRERDRKLQREIETFLEKAGLKANTDPAGGAKAVPAKDTETAGTELPDYPGQPHRDLSSSAGTRPNHWGIILHSRSPLESGQNRETGIQRPPDKNRHEFLDLRLRESPREFKDFTGYIPPGRTFTLNGHTSDTGGSYESKGNSVVCAAILYNVGDRSDDIPQRHRPDQYIFRNNFQYISDQPNVSDRFIPECF